MYEVFHRKIPIEILFQPIFLCRGRATVNGRVNGAIVFVRTATKYGSFRDTQPAGSEYLLSVTYHIFPHDVEPKYGTLTILTGFCSRVSSRRSVVGAYVCDSYTCLILISRRQSVCCCPPPYFNSNKFMSHERFDDMKFEFVLLLFNTSI